MDKYQVYYHYLNRKGSEAALNDWAVYTFSGIVVILICSIAFPIYLTCRTEARDESNDTMSEECVTWHLEPEIQRARKKAEEKRRRGDNRPTPVD